MKQYKILENLVEKFIQENFDIKMVGETVSISAKDPKRMQKYKDALKQNKAAEIVDPNKIDTTKLEEGDEESQEDLKELSGDAKDMGFKVAASNLSKTDSDKDPVTYNKLLKSSDKFASHVDPEIKKEADLIAKKFGPNVEANIVKRRVGPDHEIEVTVRFIDKVAKTEYILVIHSDDAPVVNKDRLDFNGRDVRMSNFIKKVREKEFPKGGMKEAAKEEPMEDAPEETPQEPTSQLEELKNQIQSVVTELESMDDFKIGDKEDLKAKKVINKIKLKLDDVILAMDDLSSIKSNLDEQKESDAMKYATKSSKVIAKEISKMIKNPEIADRLIKKATPGNIRKIEQKAGKELDAKELANAIVKASLKESHNK